MKVVVLGGCGAQGLFATKEFVRGHVFDEVVIADLDLAQAESAARALNSPKVTGTKVDVLDRENLLAAIADADVVVNCTGPYYLLGQPVIETVIEAGKDYVDFCDDIIVHDTVFTEQNQKLAEEKGIALIIGLGASPGVVSIMAVHGAKQMDEVDDINISIVINSGEPEGPAVILHAIENFYGTVPVIKDGQRVEENPFDGEETFDFGSALGKVKIATFGHPEIFSLPRVLPGVKNLTVKLGLYPEDGYELLKFVTMIGLADLKPLAVKDKSIVPRDFLMSLLLNEPSQMQPSAQEQEIAYSVSVIAVKGKKDGQNILYKLTKQAQMGPSTGIPLVIGAELLAQGKITKKGLLVPEECIDGESFISELMQRLQANNYPYSIKEEIISSREWAYWPLNK